MVIIGITGSIGMGKTTVSNMLEKLKIPIFDSDKKVKEILEENQNVRKKISKIWPDTVSVNNNQEKIDKILIKSKKYKDLEEKYRVEHIKRSNAGEGSDKQQLIYRDLMDMLKEISIFIDLIVERLSSLENN